MKKKLILLSAGVVSVLCLAHFLGTTTTAQPYGGGGPYPGNILVGTAGSPAVYTASHTIGPGGGGGTSSDGSTMTNLTYRYTTNDIPALTVSWGKAYFTNIAANFSILLAAPSATFFETIALWVTNSSGTDFKVTFPNGVWGTPGNGAPPAYYCTNKQLTRIMVEHYGQMGTNAYKLDFAP